MGLFRLITGMLFGFVALSSATIVGKSVAENVTAEQRLNRQRTLSVGYVVFPGWQPLDVFGPLEIIFGLSYSYKITLSVIAHATGPVSAIPPPHIMTPGQPLMDVGYMISPTIVATHTFQNAPALDILLVPGGQGNVILDQKNDTSVEDFVARRLPQLDYLLSVCTGSVSLAKAGVLREKRATTNKNAWAWVTSFGKNISWVPSARWTEDGKIWTSSGVAAGMDMTYAFFKHLYGTDELNPLMNLIEYAPHTDPSWDPYSIVHKVPGAEPRASLADCAGPVGVTPSARRR